MASLASINIKFSADLKQFSSSMQNVERRMKGFGRRLTKIGTNLTLGVTAPLLAIGTAGVLAWDKQSKAIAQVEQGLKSTGNAVGFTSESLQNMATELQNNTLFGDEEILKGATSQLLTFTNISGKQFARTQQAALDLATRLDGDLKSSAIQLGQALNDPVANLSALSRSGIQFSESQKSTINALVKTNRLAEAQTIILDELEKQYGGSAAAAAKAGLGPFKQLSNSIGDLTEDFGKIISEALIPFIDSIKSGVQWFKGLSSGTKKFIVIAAGIAAAIGPLLALAGTILPAIVAGFGFILSPLGLIIAGLTAVGVIIYKNWKPIKKTLVDIANYFVDLYNESTVFRIAVKSIVLVFKNVWSVASFVLKSIKELLSILADKFINNFKTIGKVIKAVLTGSFKDLPQIAAEANNKTTKSFSDLFKNLKTNWQQLNSDIVINTAAAINKVAKKTKLKYVKENIDTTALEEKTTEAITKGFVKGMGIGAALRPKATAITNLPTVGTTENNISPFEGVPEIMATQVEEMSDQQIVALENANEFNQGFSEIMSSVGSSAAEGFGNILGAFATGNANFSSIAGFFLQTLGNLAIRVGKMALSIGFAITGIKKALQSLNPAVAIAAGIALIALGTVFKTAAGNLAGNVPSFASGGIVSGPTLALVGEYAGANSNPEVIAPLDKLKDLIQPSAQNVVFNETGRFVVSGNDLQLILDRTSNRQNRVS